MSEASHDKNNTSTSNSTETPKIMDEADYQSAQAAVSRAIDLYNEIKPSGNANSTELANALNSLKDKIDSKSPFDQADKIVDDKITPMLNDMFKLKLAVEKDHGAEAEHASSGNETHNK